MTTPIPDRDQTRHTAREVMTHLESLRRLLVESPGRFSVTAAGAALAEVTQGLMALNQVIREALAPGARLDPVLRAEVAQILTLSGRVNALYRQASNFYGGLAAESVINGSWDGASYSPDGEWKSALPGPGSRLKAEG